MKFFVFGIGILIVSCLGFEAYDYFVYAEPKKEIIQGSITSVPKKVIIDSGRFLQPRQLPLSISEIERSIIKAGLVDIKKVDSNIVVDLKYSTCDNFLCADMYGDFNKCYLQPDVAEKLKLAQQFLRSKFPYYNLIVFDAARPRSIQYKMWASIDVPYCERSKYLSNPNSGSLHNFGAAVDISIIDKNGFELDMGTPYDFFGELAYPREEERMIFEGKLTHTQLLSRELLRSVMEHSGFSSITTEWWHFNSCSRKEAYLKYAMIE